MPFSIINNIYFVCLLILTSWSQSTSAAYVEFRNCLDNSIVNSSPRILQFVPLNTSAIFDTSSKTHNLNVTVYGNVTGRTTAQLLPPPDDPSWSNPNETSGKIPDLDDSNNKYTTLFASYNVLSYTPYVADPARFCNATVHGQCPLAPAFFANRSELTHLPAFSISHDMFSSYAFTSITAILRIQSGDASGQYYGCVSATITPVLGHYLQNLLRYMPLAVLIVVGVATIAAAILSPWGSPDIFNWSSNFGQDEDILRLVTPGFTDCLQYIQFIVLTGSLSLNYPGFYQPVVSRVGWSALMFNESFVTGGNGTQSVVDGVYQFRNNTNYGLDRMGQLIGMTSSRDMWVGMIVWLVVIIAAVIVLTQLGFVARWLYRQIANVPAEDLRSKNWPFTAGNLIRVSLNYFILPLVTLSFFQMVIAGRGPAYSVALAVLCVIAILGFAIRIMLLLTRTRPRSVLFDDLLTVLTYGPLYNTYCDDAATFAMVPVFINFLRGIAIGAVQPSGVAQLVLLAICEIVLILTINAFRPFPPATSMNVYQTCFSMIRLFTILLAIAFIPSLGVADSSRGWIGYAIFLIHACVLVFGFFLNAIQTLIEVIARLAGAGGHNNATGGAARGGLTKVFGMRQLSRRMPRRDQASRQSGASSAAMLAAMNNEQKELQMAKTQSRSVSASSTMLLDGPARNSQRMSQNLESNSAGRSTPDGGSTLSKRLTNRLSDNPTSPGGILGLKNTTEVKPPFYYRPPRRNTMDPLSATDKPGRPSFGSGDWSKDREEAAADRDEAVVDDPIERTSSPARAERDEFDDITTDLTKTKTDYAVREVDFYYGVRGPALSSGTRKLKTGPADPTGPVSSATGWFRGLLGGKSKEKNKGFEVVRSARAPPPGLFPQSLEADRRSQDPYHDDPEAEAGPADRDRSQSAEPMRHRGSLYDDGSIDGSDDGSPSKIPARPPSLPLIDTVGGIELPSRFGSEASRRSRNRPNHRQLDLDAPAVPRRSSKRDSSHESSSTRNNGGKRSKLATVFASPPPSPTAQRSTNTTKQNTRIPFSPVSPASPPGPNPNPKRYSLGAESTISSLMHGENENSNITTATTSIPPSSAAGPSYASHLRHSSSALAPHVADDRPSSIGFIQQHRASDNIHYSPDAPSGSSAEVHGDPLR